MELLHVQMLHLPQPARNGISAHNSKPILYFMGNYSQDLYKLSFKRETHKSPHKPAGHSYKAPQRWLLFYFSIEGGTM